MELLIILSLSLTLIFQYLVYILNLLSIIDLDHRIRNQRNWIHLSYLL